MMHCHSLLDVGDQERGQVYETVQGRFQDGMQGSSTAGENCVEVTRRLRWTIQISSDCMWDLTRLASKFV